MSSILKALRKLEDEKSDMGEGSVDLARDILKRSYAEHRSSSVWMSVALVAALLFVVGWWLFSSPGEFKQPKLRTEQALQPAVPLASTVAQVVAPQLQPVVIMPSRPVQVTAKAVAKRPTPPVKPSPAAAKEPAVTVNEVAVAPLIIIPELMIEEIVFVAEPSARLAVINDLPVMQGTDIDGARVIEIQADRVRFEFQGVRFDKFVKKNDEQ